MKRLNKKGFTLAELLIVVAIIAVLVAIAIPIFTSQLEKSRDAVTVANLRSAYAEASTTKLTGEPTGNASIDDKGNVTVTGVVAKGETKGFASNVDEELPFKFADKDSLDMGNKGNGTDGKFDVTFTWDDKNNVTAKAAKAAKAAETDK